MVFSDILDKVFSFFYSKSTAMENLNHGKFNNMSPFIYICLNIHKYEN